MLRIPISNNYSVLSRHNDTHEYYLRLTLTCAFSFIVLVNRESEMIERHMDRTDQNNYNNNNKSFLN